jgi:hypothetical protein
VLVSGDSYVNENRAHINGAVRKPSSKSARSAGRDLSRYVPAAARKEMQRQLKQTAPTVKMR